MVFKVIGGAALDDKIDVRLLPEEKAQLQGDADRAGMSMSALVRATYFSRPVIATADKEMIRELRQLGVELKSAHVTSGGSYSKDTAAALDKVCGLIRTLGTAVK